MVLDPFMWKLGGIEVVLFLLIGSSIIYGLRAYPRGAHPDQHSKDGSRTLYKKRIDGPSQVLV